MTAAGSRTDAPKARVAIVGGGIAGLAAAVRLQNALGPDNSTLVDGPGIVLIEASPRLGGKILTEHFDSLLIEGGPDSFLSVKPRGIGLCRELGLESRLQFPRPEHRRTFVLRHGRLHQLPEGLTGLAPTRLWPVLRSGLLSPLGKLRMALDYLLPASNGSGDESLAVFIRRRLGREAYERLVEPLMAGVFAGDGEQLSLAATFPQLRRAEQEHGGLIRGVRSTRRAGGARTLPAFVTLAGGMGELVEAIRSRLTGVQIRLGTRVRRIVRKHDGTYELSSEDGTRLQAQALILSLPAHAAAELVAGLDDELAGALLAIPHVSTATVALAFASADVSRPLDGYGYLIPRAENRSVLACTWVSSKFTGRAPAGTLLLRLFIGRASRQSGGVNPAEAPEDELLRLAREELRLTLGIRAAPIHARVYRWPQAMPQYTLGHLDRVGIIERRLAAHRGLYLAGNAYRGLGIPDCIASGEAAADRAVEHVRPA